VSGALITAVICDARREAGFQFTKICRAIVRGVVALQANVAEADRSPLATGLQQIEGSS
jgi:hypothetical protein